MKNYPHPVRNIISAIKKRKIFRPQASVEDITASVSETNPAIIARILIHLPKLYVLAGALFLVVLPLAFGIHIISGFLLAGFMLYFIYSPPLEPIQNKRQSYLMLTFLFIVFIFISKKIIEHDIQPAYIPVTGLLMLVTILYNDLKLSFAFCVLASCLAGIIANGSLLLNLIFLITGVIASILVWRLKVRIRILGAGICAGSVQMLLFWISTIPGSNFNYVLAHLFSGIISAVVVTGILPLFENLFGIVTNFSLLELSDFNHPLLKRMILEAPGTYHHSLLVGNLAEAAAESIGANSLLARIGAYYHDIGKLGNAEYFMENQKISSKHSHLSPSISKMVIMHHIKEGVELAKKYRLKPSIIDFIIQHHGTSLVYYFYRKALEEIEEVEEIQEEGFRYPGPRPTSKETAIVLLADSVEAASRVIAQPQPAKIEEVVHKIINNKFIDGQLDNCDLTLKDLEKIAEVFIHLLSGMYHGRIRYPEGSRKEGHYKKHDQANPAHQPGQDKGPHQENP